MNEELIVVLKDHIEGYGLTSDLLGKTACYGLSFEEVEKYDPRSWRTEFLPNGKIYYYESQGIRRGDLYVYAKQAQLDFQI